MNDKNFSNEEVVTRPQEFHFGESSHLHNVITIHDITLHLTIFVL